MIIAMALLGLLCALIGAGVYARMQKTPTAPVLAGVLIGAGIMALTFVIAVAVAVSCSNM